MTSAAGKHPLIRFPPNTHYLLCSGFDAALLAEQFSRLTPIPIPYRAPPNYGLIVTSVLGFASFALVARFILPIIMNRWAWAVATIVTSLIMVGGFMFVRIRGMPYIAQTQQGTQMIAPGFQSEFGIEVQIIAFICAFSFPPVQLLHLD
jgi:oligosaccharyltransferase complex subunit gamma